MLKLISWNLYLWMVAICFTATFITSCEEDDENVPVSDVALSDSELLLINGQKQTLKAIIFPAEATNKSVTWQSSSDAVATVNERGEVEAKSVGTTIITVIQWTVIKQRCVRLKCGSPLLLLLVSR